MILAKSNLQVSCAVSRIFLLVDGPNSVPFDMAKEKPF